MKPAVEGNMVVKPFSVGWDPKVAIMDDPDNHIQRYLKGLTKMWIDPSAAKQYLKKRGDILVYEVFEKEIPHRDGEIQFCSSITHPGRIREEYFMTKGHFHETIDTAEVYHCLRGQGLMLMESDRGEWKTEPMTQRRVVYVPPFYAHRSINTGQAPLISFCVYPGGAGHDYATIETKGFRKLVLEKNGNPEIEDNPKWKTRT